MKEKYSMEELAEMTRLSAKTLRNYRKAGILTGEKEAGAWRFTEESLVAFFENDMVKQSMQAKKNGMVFEFLSDFYNVSKDSVFLSIYRSKKICPHDFNRSTTRN